MKLISRILVALFLIGLTPLHAVDAVPSFDLVRAFNEFTSYLNQECAKAGQAGILLGPTEATLPEASKRCTALVDAAKDRKDIADAAQLTLHSYTYMVTNLTLAKADRKVPEDKVLADLMALNEAGPTEGQMMKCYQVTLLRLSKYFGKPSLTEEQVMGRKYVDLDFSKLPKTLPVVDANEKALYLEVTVAVAVDGGLKLNDKALPKQELVATLKKLKAEAEADGKEVLLTLYADERTQYERVADVLDAASQAKVTNVTFQAETPKKQRE